MAKLVKRILYTGTHPSIQGYIVNDGSIEFPIEYNNLIACMKSGSLNIENAAIYIGRYGVTTLKGTKGTALTKLPHEYIEDVVTAITGPIISEDNSWAAFNILKAAKEGLRL